ncbi:hypothetical protein [Mycolicibacterium sphagni]|uniref:Uncharacterized protein n=1 Tax=Mycolicibacterium sphagni TaxID=1786 RepID=A0A255DRC9_9MYCO|nr:hypothetical protein [Mycolicibacterium sphagni]OYN81794.1 hypothetical protein CG716_05480 [Mycolicibacterium sphagni]
MRIFGRKPSEIRKALVAFSAATLILLLALPVAGLPVAVAGAIAGGVGLFTGLSVYLSKPNVEAVIDHLDDVKPPVVVPPVITE